MGVLSVPGLLPLPDPEDRGLLLLTSFFTRVLEKKINICRYQSPIGQEVGSCVSCPLDTRLCLRWGHVPPNKVPAECRGQSPPPGHLVQTSGR